MPTLLWSDPATWTGTAGISPATGVPSAGDSVTIPSGVTVCVDVDTADLGMVNIMGTLTADDTVDVEFMADGIMVMSGGLLEIGTQAQPFKHKFIFTINGADPGFTDAASYGRPDNGLTGNVMMPAMRGIMAMSGGSISLFGAVPTRTKTKINEHAVAGTRKLTLADNVNWKAGDKIAISLTDYYGYGETEVLELSQDTFGGKDVYLTTPLQDFRWGRLQYVTSSGMSLVDDGSVTANSEDVPLYLDQRAEVIHMTRNIVIQAPDDALWADGGDGPNGTVASNNTGLGFGVHTMIMRGASIARANGVEFVRCGQSQRIERYGWHWHIMNYSGPTYIGPDMDPANHHVKNCTFYNSANRAVNIHGTCGVEVEETYAVKIRGHAFFMEDGSEERNSITDCVAMDVRSPAGKILITGRNSYIDGGSFANSSHNFFYSQNCCIKINDREASGFWITNPLNRVERNWASECAGMGIWNSFADQVFGLTAGATNSSGNPIVPKRYHHTAFNDNVGHSCATQGLKTQSPVIDEAGRTGAAYYDHDKADDGVTDDVRTIKFHRNSSWKNNSSGYGNRIRNPNYINWIMADNHGTDFVGATRRVPESQGGAASELRSALMIGESLNNANRQPHYRVKPFVTMRSSRRGVASYHFTLGSFDLTVVNYPLQVLDVHNYPITTGGSEVMAGGGGLISMGDLYLNPFESFFFMPGLQLINSSAGFVSPPAYFNGYPVRGPWPSNGVVSGDSGPSDYLHNSITTAVEDYWGYWGPARNHIVVNEPFFTHDMSPSAVPVDSSQGTLNLRGWTGFSTDGSRTPIAEPNPFEPYAYSTPDRMFGIGAIHPRLYNGAYPGPYGGSERLLVAKFDRLDKTTLNSVGDYIVGSGDQNRNGGVDFGSIANNPGSNTSQYMYTLFGFRHFGAMNHGYYKISYPGDPNATDTNLIQEEPVFAPPNVVFSLITENLWEADDWVIFCLPWDGNTTPYGRYQSGAIQGPLSSAISTGQGRRMDATGTSLQDVLNSSDGSVMWQDSANDVVWVKLAGGLEPLNAWMSNAQRAALTRSDVETTGVGEYMRRSLFQIRPTDPTTW